LKIGILGGTFDPVHFGHLRTAEEIGEFFELEKVYLIPSNKPPHKKGRVISSFQDRLYMIKCAIEDSDRLDVLDIEGRRSGYSYTIDTLRELTSDNYFGKEVQIYFIIGSDAFMEIETWKEYKELFKYANFVIVKRSGYNNIDRLIRKINLFESQKHKDMIRLSTGKSIYMVKVTYMDISSTQIRELVKKGKSISFLLPEKVKEYILKKGLYRK
jgi:nicotinate-nucleotide adenylyltransferase